MSNEWITLEATGEIIPKANAKKVELLLTTKTESTLQTPNTSQEIFEVSQKVSVIGDLVLHYIDPADLENGETVPALHKKSMKQVEEYLYEQRVPIVQSAAFNSLSRKRQKMVGILASNYVKFLAKKEAAEQFESTRLSGTDGMPMAAIGIREEELKITPEDTEHQEDRTERLKNRIEHNGPMFSSQMTLSEAKEFISKDYHNKLQPLIVALKDVGDQLNQ